MINNTHIEHIEDNVLKGVDGARYTINTLRSIRDMLAGNAATKLNLTVKWDGSPSIFAGIDPRDGKFFISTKSFFNKEPKLYKTAADIDAAVDGDLARKLKVALAFLPGLGIDGIAHGDLLFTKNDLKTETIQDKKYITFHPNTIVYAVPAGCETAEQIRRAKIGVAWHSMYRGDDIENMVKTDCDCTDFDEDPRVWSTSASYRDVSGNATLTKRETSEITSSLVNASRLLNNLNDEQVNAVSAYSDHLKNFINRRVVSGEVIVGPEAFVNEFIADLSDKFGKIADTRTTEIGRNSVLRKYDALRREINPDVLARLIKIYNITIHVKNALIRTLNKADTLDTFLRTEKGLEVTGPEGFVVADRFGDNVVKLVNRLEFSRANFSPDVEKGWQR